MNKFLLLFAATVAFSSCDNADSSNGSEDKTLLLEKKKIECSFEKFSDRVFVRTNVDFDLDTENYCSWIDYKSGKDSVFVNIDKNWSTDERSCNLILTNDLYNLSDTLTIIQEGYKSNGNSGGSSENGGNSSNGSGNNSSGNNGSNGNNSGGNSSNNGNSGGNINNGGSSVSRQCAAYTKKGKRCKRTASKGSIYCWQHK